MSNQNDDRGEKPYKLMISFTQSTDGEIDNRTLCEEFSVDPFTHAYKTKVMTQELSKAITAITDRMTDAAMEALGGELKVQP